MATRAEFAAFVVEQLGGEKQGVACRKMFGEYGLHGFGKFFALICDDTLYLKPTPAGEALLQKRGACRFGPPYPGASLYLQMEDLDDAAFLRELTQATLNALPEPKPKPKRKRKSSHSDETR